MSLRLQTTANYQPVHAIYSTLSTSSFTRIFPYRNA